MNQSRRKAIDEVISRLEDIEQAIEDLRDEEQEYLDNMPEGLQSGEKGEAAELAVGNFDDAIGSVGQAISELNAAKE